MKYSLLALTLASCFSSLAAHADSSQAGLYDAPTPPSLVAIEAANRQVTLSAVGTNIHYAETDSAGLLDTEDGRVKGYSVAASYMGQLFYNREYLRAEISHVSGTLGYIGAYLCSGAGYGSVTAESGATVTDYSLRFGEGFDVDNAAVLTPYVEIGHHSWQRDINEGESYSHGYAGVGLLTQFAPTSNLVLSLNVMAGRTLNPTISVAGTYGFDASLGSQNMTAYGVGVDYAITESVHASLGADRTSFKYGQSGAYYTPLGFMYEPDSSTQYTTYKLGLGVSF